METITLNEIAQATKGTVLNGDSDLSVNRLSTDSRNIPENCLFVPIVGEKMDGHSFLSQAISAGAKIILTQKSDVQDCFCGRMIYPKAMNTGIILVRDTTTALQAVGKLLRTKLTVPCIGITGSVGKTTTREMVATALSAEKKVFKTEKNYNNKLGVPMTIAEMTNDYDVAVLELGLNVRGELGTISALTDLSLAMITNIGVAHIEYYGNQDELTKEKFTVTCGFWPENPGKKLLLLNGDDPYLMKYKDSTGYPYKTYSVSDKTCDYSADEIGFVNGFSRFWLLKNGVKTVYVHLSVLGEHNVLNAVGALAAADIFGVDLEKAAEKLSEFTGFKHRLERHEKDGVLIIDDTYNASPQSMIGGVKVLSSLTYGEGTGRKFAVLGDMFELGENSAKYHGEVGEQIAGLPFDELFLVGEMVQNLKESFLALQGKQRVSMFETTEGALTELKKTLQPGDVVYLKASHGMHFEEIVEGLLNG